MFLNFNARALSGQASQLPTPPCPSHFSRAGSGLAMQLVIREQVYCYWLVSLVQNILCITKYMEEKCHALTWVSNTGGCVSQELWKSVCTYIWTWTNWRWTWILMECYKYVYEPNSLWLPVGMWTFIPYIVHVMEVLSSHAFRAESFTMCLNSTSGGTSQ